MPRDPEAPGGPEPESPSTPSAHESSVTEDPLLHAAAEIWEPPASAVEALRSPVPQRAPGRVIAKRYRLDEPLGHGGMGEVWAATHLLTRRRVAIKFLLRSAASSVEMRHRFVREARATCAVDHPNVVQVFDVVELEDETPVIVMELLSGETLRARLDRSGRLSFEETCSLLLPAVAAVATAHDLGVVHRDLKPENIFLAKEGSRGETVKVLDFGIAKLVGMGGGPSETESITGTGETLGTPCYMAPEQTLGQDVDHRADVWALGVVLYECVAGARPLQGSTVGQVVMALATEGITPLNHVAPGLPEEARGLVMQMLERDRGARPQTLWQVHELLSGLPRGAGRPVAPFVPSKRAARKRAVPRLAWVVLSVAALVITASIGWRVFGSAPGAAPVRAADRLAVASAAAVASPPAVVASVASASPAALAKEGDDAVEGPQRARITPLPPKASTRSSAAPSVHAVRPVSASLSAQPTSSAGPDRGLAETPPF